MSPAATLELTRELGPGERLLWSGQPRSGIRLTAGDAFLIPFSLCWAGFACFWEYSVIQHAAPVFFRLWGIPFVLLGVYLMAGRFFADAYRRRRTFYGLTDSRILIASGVFTRTVTGLDLGKIAQLEIRERSDGSGTISFGPSIGSVPEWMAGGNSLLGRCS